MSVEGMWRSTNRWVTNWRKLRGVADQGAVIWVCVCTPFHGWRGGIWRSTRNAVGWIWNRWTFWNVFSCFYFRDWVMDSMGRDYGCVHWASADLSLSGRWRELRASRLPQVTRGWRWLEPVLATQDEGAASWGWRQQQATKGMLFYVRVWGSGLGFFLLFLVARPGFGLGLRSTVCADLLSRFKVF